MASMVKFRLDFFFPNFIVMVFGNCYSAVFFCVEFRGHLDVSVSAGLFVIGHLLDTRLWSSYNTQYIDWPIFHSNVFPLKGVLLDNNSTLH